MKHCFIFWLILIQYHTFTSAESFDQMSSMMNPAGVSLEAPHDVVHNAVGGSFASLDITAFDSLL